MIVANSLKLLLAIVRFLVGTGTGPVDLTSTGSLASSCLTHFSLAIYRGGESSVSSTLQLVSVSFMSKNALTLIPSPIYYNMIRVITLPQFLDYCLASCRRLANISCAIANVTPS